MGWKDVPMPPRIAALPRDKRGFPVPWVSEWSTPEDDMPGVLSWHESNTPAYGPALTSCTHVDGQGEPDLGNLCAVRQIAGMHHRLCDVCGGKVKRTAWFMGAKMGEDGEGRFSGFRECAMHLECVLYAGQVCPGMVTKEPGKIWVAQTEKYALAQVRLVKGDPGKTASPTDAKYVGDRESMGEFIYGPTDNSWRYTQSVLMSLIAYPLAGEQWVLEEFLYNHGAKHPYLPWPR